MTPNNKREGWEKMFDELGLERPIGDISKSDIAEIKSFISQELSQARKEEREKSIVLEREATKKGFEMGYKAGAKDGDSEWRERIEKIEIDSVAHSKGRCSFSTTAQCCANEQQVKLDLLDKK